MKRLAIAALSLSLIQPPAVAGEIVILKENEKAQVFAVPDKESHGSSWYSFFVPGTGQMANNEWLKGALVLGGVVGFAATGMALDPYANQRGTANAKNLPDAPIGSTLLAAAALGTWVYGVYDAHQQDARRNRDADERRYKALASVPSDGFVTSVKMGPNRYALRLSKVSRVGSSDSRRDVSANVVDSDGMQFEDEAIKVTFDVRQSGIRFDLKNKLDNSAKILWDQASYIDEFGKARRVMHDGVKYVDRDQSMPPSIVPAMASISDHVTPSDNVYFGSSSWETHSLFYSGTSSSAATHMVGKDVTLLLPIQVGTKTSEYSFSFRIYGLRAENI